MYAEVSRVQRQCMSNLTTVDVGMCWLRRLCRSRAVRHTGCALITVAYVACTSETSGAARGTQHGGGRMIAR